MDTDYAVKMELVAQIEVPDFLHLDAAAYWKNPVVLEQNRPVGKTVAITNGFQGTFLIVDRDLIRRLGEKCPIEVSVGYIPHGEGPAELVEICIRTGH